MQCPFCDSNETQVRDSRPADDNSSIRRRRACPECGGRFTTFERIQLREMMVVKAGKRKQVFTRDKLMKSMQIALRKRPVEPARLEKAVNAIVRQLESAGESEISSSDIGALVMKTLATLDTVAYIRYASVYMEFAKPEDFNAFLEDLKKLQVSDADT